METFISTPDGNYIVPANRQADLIAWLRANAMRAEQRPIQEMVDRPSNPNISPDKFLLVD